MRAKILTAFLLTVAQPSFAGRGSSNGALQDAIASDSTDAIVAEVERAEFLACVSCIGTVAPLLDHRSAKVRDVAAWWLARRAVRDDVRDMSFIRLKGNDATLALHGAETLGTFRHPEAVPELSAYLSAPLDGKSGAAAAMAIGAIGHWSGVAPLTAALSASYPEIRAAAATALRGIRGDVDGMPLLPLLSDPVEDVRTQAIFTLGAFADRRAVAPLAAVLASDASPTVRKHAAWALGQIGDPKAVTALSLARGDSDLQVAGMARAALARLN